MLDETRGPTDAPFLSSPASPLDAKGRRTNDEFDDCDLNCGLLTDVRNVWDLLFIRNPMHIRNNMMQTALRWAFPLKREKGPRSALFACPYPSALVAMLISGLVRYRQTAYLL